MLRSPSNRLQLGLAILVLVCLFTASLGGVQAGGRTQGFAPTQNHSDAPALAKKTPTPTKTRKPKKTKTPTAAPTETPSESATPSSIPLTATVTETPSESATPTETLAASATPTATNTATAEPSATRKRRRTRTPTPTPTETALPTASENETFIEARRGGTLAIEDDSILIHIPPRAFARDAILRFKRLMRDNHAKDKNRQVVINRFALNAVVGNTPSATPKPKKKKQAQQGESNAAQELTQFDETITIEIHYDQATLGSWSEETLQVVYWDETLKRWMPLASVVDTENDTITAETNHFTDFGLANAPDLQNYLPTLEGFQTDLFTGAAGYSFPIALPPGVGGLTPRLGLSYSSAGTDLFNSLAQSSLVGAGWAFDTSYIARDTQNTRSTGDDRFSLSLNGSGYDLVYGLDGKYHTNKEQFWRIRFYSSGNKWEVITNDGTKYLFGETANSIANEIRRDEWNNLYTTTYQWNLEKVTDAHGNTINYTYAHEGGSCSQGSYDLALRPDRIEYNQSGASYLTRIEFAYSTRNDRNVYFPANQCGAAPYQKKKLDRITVRTTDNGGALQQVRAYAFTYDYSTWPGVYHDHGDGTGSYGRLTLLQIQTFGSDNSSTLPPYVFTYNKTRLKTATNSIGGKVKFVYDTADAGPHSDKYDQDYTTWTCGGSSCTIPSYAFWTKLGGSGYTFDVRRDPLNQWALAYQVPPTSNSNYLRWKVSPFIVDSNYVFTNTLTTSSANVQVQVRLYDDSTHAETNLNNWTYITPNTAHNLVVNFTTAPDLRFPELRLYIRDSTGANPRLFIERTLLQPQSTHHRVTTKTVQDGMGGSNDWTYAYSGIATNNPTLSEAVNTQNPRHPKYSQFRGHAQVTVTDPLGNQSVNFFAQDDLYVGRATEIRQRDGSGKNYTKTLNDYTRVNYDTYQPFTYAGDRIDFIKLNWSQVETYDGNNTNPKTRRTDYEYDSYGNVSETREKDETGAVVRKTFKEFYPADVTNGAHITNKTARVYVTDANGNRVSDTRYLYDNNSAYNQAPTLGELKRTQVTADGTNFFDRATFGYDSYGNVTSVTDARGKTTTTAFDAQYHLFAESVDPPLLPATTTSYDKRLGLVTSTTDPNGAVTSTTFDVFGRRMSVTTPLDQGYAATADYDYCLPPTCTKPLVHVRVRKDLGGANTPAYQEAWYFLDGLGRVIQKQAQAAASGQIILVNTSYDERGKVKYVSQPYAVSASGGIYVTPDWSKPKFLTEYDPLGRVKKVTHPDGTFTTTSYDHWLTTSTDANGHKKDFLMDAFGRTTRVREYQANAVYATTTYAYDRLDRLTDTWDNANNNTHLTYDWLGRKTVMNDPDMGMWAYVYDTAGNLTEQRDARNASVCFNYDDLNRVTTKTARNGTNCSAPLAYTVTYGYDSTAGGNKGWGRRTSLNDPNGSQTWMYDLHGRVVSTAQSINGAPANPYTTSFTYDAMERVRTLVYPDGEVVTSAYNNQGLPDTLNGANNYVSATTYNAASQLDSLTFGNSALTDYVYNSNNLRLTDIVTTKSGNTLLNLHYNFDNVGNILSVQDNARGETTNYAYDDLDRLLSASVTTGGNQYSRSWTYDALGNMQTRVEQGSTTNYSYDPNHKHAVASAGGATYQYDANGNMTNRNGDALTYDVENRLTSVAKSGVTTSFGYNGDGARVKRSVSNAGTTYYIGNYFEVWVPNSGTTTFNKYYYFGAQRVAARIASTLFYFQGDHLGSSSVAMTQAGTSFYSRQTYFPYGAQRTTEGNALPTDNTFTGQKSDDSTGLLFYNARYYDTTLGRFTQPDTIVPNPLNPQSLNRFAYVLNNPLKYTDPTGHMFCEEGANCDGGGGSGGGGTGGGGSGDNNGNTPSETNAQPPADTASDQMTNEGTCQGPRRKCDPDYDPEIDEDPVTGQDSPTRFIAQGYDGMPQWVVTDRVSIWLDAHPGYVAEQDTYYPQYSSSLGITIFQVQAQKAAKSTEPFTLDRAFSLAGPLIGSILYRSGGTNPGNLIDKSGKGLSFRDSLSNPWPLREGHPPVFNPGKDWFAIDTDKLRVGSVVYDNNPMGHVSIYGSTPDALKEAIIDWGKFSK